MVTTRQIQVAAASVGAVAAAGVLGYAVWFDYKRRNDPEFRKKLKKEHKKVHVSTAKEAKANKEKTTQLLKAHLKEIAAETLPTAPDAREQYFMENVAVGEGLAQAGPANEVPAALAFYRALRVYPSPVELIMIYQKTVPAPIFAMLMELTSLDMAAEQAGSPHTTGEKRPQSSAPAAVTSAESPTASEDAEHVATASSDAGTNGEWEKISTGAGGASASSAAANTSAETAAAAEEEDEEEAQERREQQGVREAELEAALAAQQAQEQESAPAAAAQDPTEAVPV